MHFRAYYVYNFLGLRCQFSGSALPVNRHTLLLYGNKKDEGVITNFYSIFFIRAPQKAMANQFFHLEYLNLGKYYSTYTVLYGHLLEKYFIIHNCIYEETKNVSKQLYFYYSTMHIHSMYMNTIG